MLKNVVKMVQTFGMSLKSAIENFQFMGLRILSELSGYGVKLEYRSIVNYYYFLLLLVIILFLY